MRVTVGGILDVGIDPAGEELVERWVERWTSEDAAADVIPREGRQVPQVKDEGVTEGDRLREPSLGRKDREDLVRARPHGAEPFLYCLGHVHLQSERGS